MQTMPDGAQLYVYGFTDDPDGQARVPGPAIQADAGDTVRITLVNDRDPNGGGHGLRVSGGLSVDGPSMVAAGASGMTRKMKPGDPRWLKTATRKRPASVW